MVLKYMQTHVKVHVKIPIQNLLGWNPVVVPEAFLTDAVTTLSPEGDVSRVFVPLKKCSQLRMDVRLVCQINEEGRVHKKDNEHMFLV